MRLLSKNCVGTTNQQKYAKIELLLNYVTKKGLANYAKPLFLLAKIPLLYGLYAILRKRSLE